jgi:rod shape-determining protein MreB and related proteins
MAFFKTRLGIDLGTANSLVWLAGEGIVLNEPTVVAVSVRDRKVLAVGNEAKEMLGRTPGSIVATRPMRDGVIADYVVTEAMLRFFIQKVLGKRFLIKPEVMICVPAGCTQVERRAVLDATMSAGARAAYLIDEPLAAAIGAHIPIAEASGNMILDIGGGAAEAAVISLGGVVRAKSVRVGGNKIDEAIVDYVRRTHSLVIGDTTAEQVKMTIGTAVVPESKTTMRVKGRDTVSGLPRDIELSNTEITQAINRPLLQIVGVVKTVLEDIPPELSSDIIDKGIVMSGGTSLLTHLDKMLSDEMGVPCHVAEDALHCVINGTGIALENLDLYRRSVGR